MRNVSERGAKAADQKRAQGVTLLVRARHRLRYYGLALLFVAAAGILRWALPDVLGPTPFLAFYLAWVAAAAFGGLGPGLLATAASWLCIDLLFDPAGSLINFADPTTIGRLVILLAGGLAVSFVAEKMRRGRIHERRQAQDVAQAKQEWERTFDAVPDLIAIIDPQQRILRANRALAERVGTTPEGCIGLMCYRCVHHRDTPPAYCPHAQTLADGQQHVAEVYEERLGGNFLISCTPLFDQQGQMVGTVQVARDITERKQAEERLRESEERYRSLFENMLDGYAYCRMLFDEHDRPVDFVYVNVNDAFARLTGLENVIGRKVTEVIPGIRESYPELLEIYGRVALAGQPERFEIEFKPLGIWLSISVYSSQRGYFTAVFDNITVRKQAEEAMRKVNEQLQRQAEELQAQAEELQTQTEELRLQTEELAAANAALRQSEERLRQRAEEVETLMELAPAAIWVAHDPQCNQISGNRAADSFYEAQEEENVSANASSVRRFFRGGRELKPEELPMQEAAARNVEVRNTELDVLLPSGRWLNMLGSASPLRDAEGRARGCVGAFVDITERKRMEETLREFTATLENKVAQRTKELERRTRQLQKLTLELSEVEDRERRRLAEILHDDLQQVLAAAKFHLSLLSNRVKRDSAQHAVAVQIDHMLKDAIDKSRNLSHELSPAVLHHSDFAGTLGWLANQVQTKHGLVVHVDAAGEIPLQSDALKAFLYQAARELLFNVVKHARVNEARIRVRRLGRCIGLSVSDQGRGFDLQEIKETPGFGLLSIRERVELLGGRMKIKSAAGQGSTFRISVLDAESSRVNVEVEPRPRGGAKRDEFVPGQEKRRLRVLLADDHEIVREGLTSLLREEPSIEVVGEATNGREAVDLAHQLGPDVVIMDVAMPLMSGDEATRQIKRNLPQIRIIALSMYEEPEVAERMRQAGAERYVLKTAPSEELLAAVRGADN